MSALDIFLRLVGAFYLFGAVMGLKQAAMGNFMSDVLDAIGTPDPREAKADRQRTYCLAFNMALVGVGGILLMALLEVAAVVFVVSLAFYAAYLFVLAPRYLDPYDPPEPAGRSQTRNAFWVYGVATLLVLFALSQGRLESVAAAPGAVSLLALAASLGLIGYAAWGMHASSLRASGKPGDLTDEL